MKVLQLCLRVPYPPNDGGNIAMYYMAQSLAFANCDVHTAAINTVKHHIDIAELPADFVSKFHFTAVSIDTSIKIVKAVANLFTNESYNVVRFDNEAFHLHLHQLLQNNTYDVVQFESLFMAPYLPTIRKYSQAKCVLRAHNVEWNIWHRLYMGESQMIKKCYLQLLTKRLYRYEKSVVNNFDGVISFTEEDIQLFRDMGCTKPIAQIPISIDTEKYKATATHQGVMRLYHLGGMDWLPNLEAMEWWLKSIQPQLDTQLQNVEFHMAGVHMPQRMMAMANNRTLFVSEKIVNVQQYISDKHVLVVPLLSGGGMRVKILEAMGAGMVVISTAIGAEGIRAKDGEHLLIANTPDDFIQKIKLLQQQPTLLTTIGRNAQALASTMYDMKNAGLGVVQFYHSLHH